MNPVKWFTRRRLLRRLNAEVRAGVWDGVFWVSSRMYELEPGQSRILTVTRRSMTNFDITAGPVEGSP